MNCYVCGTEENFHSMEKINPERELLVCKTCGNVCYRVDPAQEQKMKDYYRYNYRPAPTWVNLLTTAHKLNYIMNFLGEFLKDKKGLVCGDVGSATGYVPNHLRKLGHKATGCEYTVTFRRFAEHFYGVPLTEELETKHKYDLITIYHVLEHMVEPDKKLAHFVSLLAENGRIMVATPEWFNVLEEASGSEIQDFTHLFHKDHINVFSEKSLKALFRRCGLVVEKEDHITYGQTYLLRKATAVDQIEPAPVENWEERRDDILRAKKAIDTYKEALLPGRPDTTKLREAIALWPKFPEAWIKLIMEAFQKSPERQVELWEECRKHLEDNCRIRQTLGIWCYQQENWAAAMECFGYLTQHRPHEDIFTYMGWCLSHMGRPKEAIQAFTSAYQLYPMKWQEAVDWQCQQAVSMPCWQERAEEEIKKQMMDENRANIEMRPVDKVMDNGSEKEPVVTAAQ